MELDVKIEKELRNFILRADFTLRNEVFALLGASGCGKSMTLKCIAGLERPDRGRIVLDGRVLFDSERGIDLLPQERRVGYLFQNFALFPNMTIAENIRFVARGARARESRALRPHGARQRVPDGALGGASSSARHSRASSHPMRRSCCSTSRSRRSTTT